MAQAQPLVDGLCEGLKERRFPISGLREGPHGAREALRVEALPWIPFKARSQRHGMVSVGEKELPVSVV